MTSVKEAGAPLFTLLLQVMPLLTPSGFILSPLQRALLGRQGDRVGGSKPHDTKLQASAALLRKHSHAIPWQPCTLRIEAYYEMSDSIT